jgi:hypothetical protein
MAHKPPPPKKGPQGVKTAFKRRANDETYREQVTDTELESKIAALAQKTYRVIQKARSKMDPVERARADRNANEILDEASAAARRPRRRA